MLTGFVKMIHWEKIRMIQSWTLWAFLKLQFSFIVIVWRKQVIQVCNALEQWINNDWIYIFGWINPLIYRHCMLEYCWICIFYFVPSILFNLVAPGFFSVGGDRKFSVLWIFGSILLCALAMLCKEQGITVLVSENMYTFETELQIKYSICYWHIYVR